MENASGPRAGKNLLPAELCPCGKPAAHLTAPEDSRDWACRVPNFDPATGQLCPPWCLRHEDADVGRPDAFRVHRGAIRLCGDISVQIERTQQLRDGAWEAPVVLLDGRDLPVQVARALSSTLAQVLDEANQ